MNADLTPGCRVEYVGTTIPRLIGRRGRFLRRCLTGLVEVDFDDLGNVGPLRVSPKNLRTVED